jgi:hypothetical protein
VKAGVAAVGLLAMATPLVAGLDLGVRPGLWRVEQTNSLRLADGPLQTGRPSVHTMCERTMDFSVPHEECRDLGTKVEKGRISVARQCANANRTAIVRVEGSYSATSLEGVETTTLMDRNGRFLQELTKRTSARRIGNCTPEPR